MTKRDREDFGRTVQRLTDRRVDGRDPIMDAETLHRISGSIHRYDERLCSEDMGEREQNRVEKRVENLEKKAREIASAYGFRAFFQGDCRGCPLYLIPESFPATEDDSNYSSRGLAVVWFG